MAIPLDEVFEIRDGGTVLFSRTIGDGAYPLGLLSLSFGECGTQTISFEISDPTDNNIDSWAWVDHVMCSCDAPIPVDEGTWGEIKSLYRTP